MITSGVTTRKIRRFKKDFEDDYVLELLPPAGPLTPSSESLTVLSRRTPTTHQLLPPFPTTPARRRPTPRAWKDAFVECVPPQVCGTPSRHRSMRRPLRNRAATPCDQNPAASPQVKSRGILKRPFSFDAQPHSTNRPDYKDNLLPDRCSYQRRRF